MTLDEERRNKDIVTRFVKATNDATFAVLDELVVEDYRENEPIPGQGPGRAELKRAYKTFNTPFPDLHFVFADVIAEGDLVVGRGVISGTHRGEFFGVPPTGKVVHWTGTRLFRLRNGRIVEGWVNLDMLGLMQQLGVVPAPPAGPAPAPAKHLTGAPSTREANKALMQRFIERVWNQGDLDVADEVFHPEATSPTAPGLPPGGAGVKVIAGMFRKAFPDYHIEITHMVAEDDRVAARFWQSGTHQGDLMGIAPTGKKAAWSEIGILRIADGRVVESWYDVDMLGLMGQLGVGGSDGR